MEDIEIPSYFLCPISLQIMRDPVTLSTGITYDRASIERWLFTDKHRTCPLTKQPLPDLELTPNHTLRRLTQAWCVANASNGVERFPTPRPPVDKAQIAALLEEAKLPESQMSSLRKLKAIISESERNKRCVEASAAVDVLASIINTTTVSIASPRAHHEEFYGGREPTSAGDEALGILCALQLSEERLFHLIRKNDDFIASLTALLSRSNVQSRVYAMSLLQTLLSVISPTRLTDLSTELFQEVVKVLRDRVSDQATKAALKALGGVSPWGRNRMKAVQAGAVPVLIDFLLDGPDQRRQCELTLVVLDQMCGCADGRAELVAHAAGIAVVSKKILRVSHAASERAVRVLHSVAKFSATPAVLQEMVQVGAVAKLCLLLQAGCGVKTKEKVKDILGLHSKVWRGSPCLSAQSLVYYPC